MIFGIKSERFIATAALPSALTLFDLRAFRHSLSQELLQPLIKASIGKAVVTKMNEGHYTGKEELPVCRQS